MPQLSVIIATHDRPEMVVRAVRSALGQTMQDIEVIVVDDASRQDPLRWLEGIGDDRVRLEQMPRNVGQGAARNRGIELARGAWVAFLDDDDEWLPKHLEGLLKVAEGHPASGVLYRPYLTAAWERILRRRMPLPTGDVIGELASGWAPSLNSSLVVRRDLCEPGYDPVLVGIEDYDFWLELGTRTDFSAHPAPLVIVDKTPRFDRTNLAVARRLHAVGHLEEKWSERMRDRGLGEEFAATCEQIRLATLLTAGGVTSLDERVSAVKAALATRAVSPATRLSGVLRMSLGARATEGLQRAWFLTAGLPRDRVVARAARDTPTESEGQSGPRHR